MVSKNNIEDYLKVYNTIYPKQKFTYMSLPITTGPKFIDWYVETGQYLIRDSVEYKRLHNESVIFENIKLSRNYSERLFDRFKTVIINPTGLDADFTQEEFMIFWDEFIREYVDRIVFMPGWALSKGSLAEYIISVNNNIDCWRYENGSFNGLSKQDAIRTISTAIETLNDVGFNSHMQENVLDLLKDESSKIRI